MPLFRTLVVLFFISGSQVLQAGVLWLKPEVQVAEGFLRLSDLLETPQKDDRFSQVFLGMIKKGGEKKLFLSYLKERLLKKGYLTVEPAVKTGLDFVVVKGVEGQAVVSDIDQVQVKKHIETVLVLKESLQRGMIIREEMLEHRPMTKGAEDAYKSLDQVVGYRLERNLGKGTAIKPRYVAKPPLIKKGDMVKVIIKSPGIEISGIAKALEDGHLGATIAVRRGHESLQAQVLDKQTVVIQ